VILNGDIVILAADRSARGTVIDNSPKNTVLVKWDFDTNPYGKGAPRTRYELRRSLRVVYFNADGEEYAIEGDDYEGYPNGYSPISYTGNA
jgi:hypothetical protein